FPSSTNSSGSSVVLSRPSTYSSPYTSSISSSSIYGPSENSSSLLFSSNSSSTSSVSSLLFSSLLPQATKNIAAINNKIYFLILSNPHNLYIYIIGQLVNICN